MTNKPQPDVAVQADHSTVEKILYDLLGDYHLSLNGVTAHEPFYGTADPDSDLKDGERCDDEAKKSFVESAVYAINKLNQTPPPQTDIPPKGCTCASFWTVRKSHKKDCPLYQPPQTEQNDAIKLFRTMVDDLVRWHCPLPKAKHEKLVSDIMLHVPKLLTASNREARIDELKRTIVGSQPHHTDKEIADAWDLMVKTGSVADRVLDRLAELKGKPTNNSQSEGTIRLKGVGGNKFGVFGVAIDNFWVRVFGKGLSIQPLNDEIHAHLFSTRHAKIQPLHIFNHCIRILR